MTGAKAVYLHDWAQRRGVAFLRFDYRGHGESSGAFEDGCIGDWADDAREAMSQLTDGPQILVGSSMGGWIGLLLARLIPERVAGYVGIAAAPDFSERRWEAFTDVERSEILTEGRLELPSQYSEAPYVYTRKLFEDGHNHLVLKDNLKLNCPVRLLHGTADPDVPVSVSMQLLDHVDCEDARLTLIKDGDHRLSTPEDLSLLGKTLHGVLAGAVSRD
ncbi:MAG: alpha/beta hydrolase [Pseudomonadota bacterium]